MGCCRGPDFSFLAYNDPGRDAPQKQQEAKGMNATEYRELIVELLNRIHSEKALALIYKAVNRIFCGL